MRSSRIILAALALAIIPGVAMAHPAIFHEHTFLTGLAHPLTGLDHLLAMVAVGLWASQKGGRALWLWPGAFVGAMLAGGALGMNGVALPGIEPGIAASLLVLGLMITTTTTLPLAAGAGVIALFGLFHGNAHGLEAPLSGGGALYGLGFALATALLHAAGVGMGVWARRVDGQMLLRLGAGLIAATGAVLLFA
jgi:urease accessory protein